MTFRISNSLKITAFITLLIFSAQSLLQAAPQTFDLSAKSKEVVSAPPFLKSPKSYFSIDRGRVEEQFLSQSTPFIYLVEDAHDSLDAQESIRQILKQLVEKEKVSLVCFEGGSEKLDRSFYDFTHNPSKNKKIWDELFKQGQIGGLERYALEASEKVKFSGLENKKVYFENIHSIQKIFREKEKVQSVLNQIDIVFDELGGKLVTGDAKKIRDFRKSFDDDRLNLIQYAKGLVRSSDFSRVNQREWPQIARIIKLQEFELKLKQHEVEIQKELEQVKKKTSSDLGFIWFPDQHEKVKGHLRWYFEKAVDQGLNFKKYPNLSHWVGYHVLQDEISAGDLFEELEQLETDMLSKLEVSAQTKTFLKLDHDYVQVKKLISLEVSRKEWNQLKRDNLNLKQLAKQLCALYKETFHRKPKIRVWDALRLIKLFNIAKSNYEIVEMRDQILSKQIQNRVTNANVKKAAVVTGGFHTDKIAAFLKAHKIGYAVISPVISDVNNKVNYRTLIDPELSKTRQPVVGAFENSPEVIPFQTQLRMKEQTIAEGLVGQAAGQSLGAEEILDQSKSLLWKMLNDGTPDETRQAREVLRRRIEFLKIGVKGGLVEQFRQTIKQQLNLTEAELNETQFIFHGSYFWASIGNVPTDVDVIIVLPKNSIHFPGQIIFRGLTVDFDVVGKDVMQKNLSSFNALFHVKGIVIQNSELHEPFFPLTDDQLLVAAKQLLGKAQMEMDNSIAGFMDSGPGDPDVANKAWRRAFESVVYLSLIAKRHPDQMKDFQQFEKQYLNGDLNKFFRDYFFEQLPVLPWSDERHLQKFIDETEKILKAYVSGASLGKKEDITLQGGKYHLVELPQDTKLTAAIQDLSPAEELKNQRISIHLFVRLYDFIADLLNKVSHGDESLLRKAMDEEEKETHRRLIDEENPRGDFHRTQLPRELASTGHILRIFLNPQEVASIRSIQTDFPAWFHYISSDQAVLLETAYRLMIHLLRIIRDRDVLKDLTEAFKSEQDRWTTPEVRKHIVPLQFVIFHAALDQSQYGEFDPENEIKRLVSGISKKNISVKRLKEGKWAKDQRLWLPWLSGYSRYYLTLDMTGASLVKMRDVFQERIFDPEMKKKIKINITEGGASVNGEAKTPFMIFADDVEAEAISDFASKIKTIPGYESTHFYTLPSGYATFKYEGNIYLLPNRHLDTVMGFIPKRITNQDKNILLIDPWYHREVAENPEFKKFVEEQNVTLVNVDEEETYLNPANFAVLPDGRLFFNFAPKTLAKLDLKENAYMSFENESEAMKLMPVLLGSVGCLTGIEEMTEEEVKPAEPVPPVKIKIEKAIIAEMLRGMKGVNNVTVTAIYENAKKAEPGFFNESELQRFVEKEYDEKRKSNTDSSGSSLGQPETVSLNAVMIVRDACGGIIGLYLKDAAPEIYQSLISRFASDKPAGKSLVITGPVSPIALIDQIKGHKTVIVYYEDEAYKKEFEQIAAKMKEKGDVLQEELNRYGYFAYLPKLHLTRAEFVRQVLKNVKMDYDGVGPRSIGRIASQSGIRNYVNRLVWQGDEALIHQVIEKMPVVLGRPLRVTKSGNDDTDLIVLKLASLLSENPEALEKKGLLVLENGIYVPTDLFYSFLDKALADHNFEKLTATMA